MTRRAGPDVSVLVSGIPIATWGTELYVDDVTLTAGPWFVRYSCGEGQTKILYCTHTHEVSSLDGAATSSAVTSRGGWIYIHRLCESQVLTVHTDDRRG
jgi:hypothetical protein